MVGPAVGPEGVVDLGFLRSPRGKSLVLNLKSLVDKSLGGENGKGLAEEGAVRGSQAREKGGGAMIGLVLV